MLQLGHPQSQLQCIEKKNVKRSSKRSENSNNLTQKAKYFNCFSLKIYLKKKILKRQTRQ